MNLAFILISVYYLVGVECTFQYYKRANLIDEEYNEFKTIFINPFIIPMQWGVTYLGSFYLLVKSKYKSIRYAVNRRLELKSGRISKYKSPKIIKLN